MADIDQIIAGGAKTNANFDFGSLLDAYYKGQDQRYQQEGRNLFRGGVPTGPDGNPDFAAMSKALFQHGDVGQGTALSNLDIQRQQLKMGQDAANAMGGLENGGQPSLGPPSSNRNASAVVARPLNRGGVQAQGDDTGGAPSGGGTTLLQVASAAGIPNDQIGAVGASLSRQLGLSDPNAPIDMSDPRTRNVVIPALQQFKRAGVGQVVPPGAPTPPPQVVGQASPPQAAPVPNPQQNQGTFGPPPATPTRGAVPTGMDPEDQKRIAIYTAIAGNPAYPKSVQEAAQTRLKAFQDAAAPTGQMKEYDLYRRQGGKLGFNEWQTDLESGKAGATEQAKADVKERQDIIGAGREAQQRLGTLNTVANIINTDKDLTLGFGGETALKVKKALQQMGVDVGDLSGAQTIEKLNAQLASEAAKSVSPRPAQFEFKTFLNNNPGLSLDKAGNLRVIGIFSQLAKRDVDLGRLARQTGDNWQQWDNVVSQYDKTHPIRDPVTNNVLSTDSVIAPGKPKGDTTAQPTQFREGQFAVNPKTGERVRFTKGRWEPST